MNEELNDKEAVLVSYDNPQDPEVMRISLPIKHFAENQIGTVLLKGFMEDIKEVALKQLFSIRGQKSKSQIIVPRGAPELKVH